MALLVTGGTGFLGSYVTRYALSNGGADHVYVVDRYVDKGRIADVLDRVTIIEGDVSDPELVERTVKENAIDRIAHFAFILGSPSVGQMQSYVKVQLLGTANVLESARVNGVRRVLFASSVAAYGQQEAEVLGEDLVPNPRDPYGAAKVWCETMARHYNDVLGLDTVTVRYGSTYGLGRAWRGSYASGMLNVPQQVHYMARVEDAVRGKSVTMPRDDTLADWTYAGDAAKAAWLALTAETLPSRLYNAGSVRSPVGAFTRAMQELLPEVEIATSSTETPGNPHKPMDCSRLRTELGYAPDNSLESGLIDYVERIRIYDRYRQRTEPAA